MILTDREIQIALDHRALVIDPAPLESAYSSTSVDLTLDSRITEFNDQKRGLAMCVDPAAPGYSHEDILEQLTKPVGMEEAPGYYDLPPGRLILAWSREYVKLETHARLAARVEGKSSLARLGLAIHITAPTIHAGFAGQIRLEMINHGVVPIRLRPDMKICQLIFEQTLGTPVRGYIGRFADQTAAGKRG